MASYRQHNVAILLTAMAIVPVVFNFGGPGPVQFVHATKDGLEMMPQPVNLQIA